MSDVAVPETGEARPVGRVALLGLLALCAALVFGVIAAFLASGDGRVTSYNVGGSYRLVDPAGRTVTEASWPGRFKLIYFGYTHCPDQCPLTLAQIAAALDRMGPDADLVQPLFVTVDPARDTEAVLAAYTHLFSPRIIGLTGSPAALATMRREFGVLAAAHPDGPGGYLVDHTGSVYLMSPTGHLVETIDPEQAPDAMATRLIEDMR